MESPPTILASQASDSQVGFVIYRVADRTSEGSPFAGLTFHPPMGSDALWKALEAAYPELDDNSWRIQYALADWARIECITYGYKRAPVSTGETIQTSFSEADPHSGSPSYESSQSYNLTPIAMTPSGSEGLQRNTLDFGGNARVVHTRRPMKKDEKAHMQMIKKEGGACDGCKKQKKKCDAEHIRERSAPPKRLSKMITTPKRGPTKEAPAGVTASTGRQIDQLFNPLSPTNSWTAQHEDTTTQANSWSQQTYSAAAEGNFFSHGTFDEDLSHDIFAGTADTPHVPTESTGSNHIYTSTLNEHLRHAGPGFTSPYASPMRYNRVIRDSSIGHPLPPPG
ncbi:hypothetical protein W97_07782 [Coniosporium apollinis CBS 100218]|uniref:Uncharacterized protein n=1 Tax=Coniosporium apollinis (strain CBS 100218) TaxID=1168221 RepID=R7Z3B7_CONA1|nr:uncharacterized protein W97_07782 [Coniosporium apollinis CBS 100218]EON68524.1 hypothetical protein W97_07782 [Coniosporium apollinis CBS 100218]